MSKLLISNKKIILIIGCFKICILPFQNADKAYFISEKAEQFLVNKADDNYGNTLNYTISLEDTFTKPKELPIAEFIKGPFPLRIFKNISNGYLWVRQNIYEEIQLVYEISEDWSSWKLIEDNSGSLGIYDFAELAYIFAYSILNKGGILFHGVVMEWQGMGIIFCAHSKVGKSTHTSMWRDNENADILNGDRALCCQEENNWYTYGAPWCGSSEEFRNRRAPLSAVVILEQAGFNEASVLSPFQGAMELIQLAFAPAWEENLMNCSLDSIDSIVQNVPVLKLKCRPDLEAVKVLKVELQKINDRLSKSSRCQLHE